MRIREHMVTHGREIQLPEGETTKGLMEETGEIVRECAPESDVAPAPELPETAPSSWPVELEGGTFTGINVESPVESGIFWVFADEAAGYDQYATSIEEPEEGIFAEQYEAGTEDPGIAYFTGGDNEAEAS